MVKFNAETRVADLQHMHKIASYHKGHESCCIVEYNARFVVATFNNAGFCTNAVEYHFNEKREAWKFFIELIGPDLEA